MVRTQSLELGNRICGMIDAKLQRQRNAVSGEIHTQHPAPSSLQHLQGELPNQAEPDYSDHIAKLRFRRSDAMQRDRPNGRKGSLFERHALPPDFRCQQPWYAGTLRMDGVSCTRAGDAISGGDVRDT